MPPTPQEAGLTQLTLGGQQSQEELPPCGMKRMNAALEGPAFKELGAGCEGEKHVNGMQNVIVYDGI